MKWLTLIRHAKSSWDDPAWQDFDRPLNERGRKDAARMAKVLRQREVVPEVVVASTALRAFSTAEILVAGLQRPEGALIPEERLYEASPEQILAIVRALDDRWQHVALVGHNPGFEQCLERLSGEAKHMSTCAVAHLEFATDRWRDARPGAATLLAFLTPKTL